MEMRALGRTDLRMPPLVFGGNVFGWTIDRSTSFMLLDRLMDAGFNTVDTADVYSIFVPGNTGGESETIIGEWLASRRCRDKVTVITKGGMRMGPGREGLSATYIARAVESSLRRMRTDYIDVYFSHCPDDSIPHEETLGAYQKLIAEGKIRIIGASNFDAKQLTEALDSAKRGGLPRYDVIQPLYNLYERDAFEGSIRDIAMAEGLGVITFFSLANGFLSGKYRSVADLDKSRRGAGIKKFLNDRGMGILDALENVAARHDSLPTEVALAWAMSRPGVTSPIASATNLQQVESLIRSAALKLEQEDFDQLNCASEPAGLQ